MQVDISQEAEVQRMIARACEEFGVIHILVNNAARFIFNFVTDITEEGNSTPLRVYEHVQDHILLPAR